jgi:hypothetical protein
MRGRLRAARSGPGGRVVIASAAVGVVMLGLLLVEALRPRAGVVASNTRVIASAGTRTLPAGGSDCERGQEVPRAAAHALLYAAVPPPLAGGVGLAIERADGTILQRGSARPGPRRATLLIDLAPRAAGLVGVTVCVVNSTPAPVSFAGNLVSSNPEAPSAYNLPEEGDTESVRVDLLPDHRRSLLGELGPIVRRATYARPSGYGVGVVWAAIALILGATIACAALCVRELRRFA